jgi:hypothetical protein
MSGAVTQEPLFYHAVHERFGFQAGKAHTEQNGPFNGGRRMGAGFLDEGMDNLVHETPKIRVQLIIRHWF